MRKALLVVLLASAACHSTSPAPGATASDPGILVTDPVPSAGDPVVPPAGQASMTATLTVKSVAGGEGPFPIGDVDRLSLAVDCANAAPGEHDVRVDVMSPSGTLYAQIPGRIETAAGQASSSSVLWIRGTTVESYRQVGRWSFVAYVDGQPLASAEAELTE